MYKKEVLERFLRYAVVDTMSNEELAETRHPSTDGQWDLLRMLRSELEQMGVEDVNLDDNGYLIARISANAPDLPCIGFCSHVDTADDVDGNHVKPRVIENYDGKDVVLSDKYTIRVADNPELEQYKGTAIIVTDGETLLGSDDKGGVAEIMTAVSYLMAHPEIRHGEIEIIFSPDEGTGHGMDYLDPRTLHSEAVYTVDGSARYEIECECFNAATVKIHFCGVSYHLGSARGRLVNAITMASSFISAVPQAESPEATDGRYGYYCVQEAHGNATDFYITCYLRDFDLDGLKARIENLEHLAKSIEMLFKGGKAVFESRISYYNMVEAARKKPKAMDAVFEAGKVLGMPLETKIIRGGTDGARIAECGIPCPNLFVGGHNLHSRYEWCALEAMNDSTRLLVEIVRQWAK